MVSMKRRHQDLLHWDDLYVAGRLHKPVIHILRGNLEVAQSISTNLDAALRLALLLLPPRFSERVCRTSTRVAFGIKLKPHSHRKGMSDSLRF